MPLFEFQCPVDGLRFELLLPSLPGDERAACPLCGALSPLVPSLPTMRPDPNWHFGKTIGGVYLNSAKKIARARKEQGIVELGGRNDREAMKKLAEEGQQAKDAKLERDTYKHFEKTIANSGVVDSFGEPVAGVFEKLSDQPITSTKDERLG